MDISRLFQALVCWLFLPFPPSNLALLILQVLRDHHRLHRCGEAVEAFVAVAMGGDGEGGTAG